MKKASIVIPVYNGGNYIRDAIDSALSQDYGNTEVIVSDGGSTDNTSEVCLEYGDKITYKRHEERVGLAYDWDMALSHCRGDYIKMLCHDDIITKDCVSKQVAELDTNPSVNLVACARVYLDQFGNIIGVNQWAESTQHVSGNDIMSQVSIDGNVIGETSCALFRNIGVQIDQNLNWLIDLYMWASLLSSGDYIYTPDTLCGIRKHPEQDTHRVLRDPDYESKESSDWSIVLKKTFSGDM